MPESAHSENYTACLHLMQRLHSSELAFMITSTALDILLCKLQTTWAQGFQVFLPLHRAVP